MADIVFQHEASADIERIYRFSLSQFGKATADAYHDGLLEAVLRLESYPEMGRQEPGIVPPIRSLPFRSHKLYYRFDGQTILVVRILHQAMNAGSHLASRQRGADTETKQT